MWPSLGKHAARFLTSACKEGPSQQLYEIHLPRLGPGLLSQLAKHNSLSRRCLQFGAGATFAAFPRVQGSARRSCCFNLFVLQVSSVRLLVYLVSIVDLGRTGCRKLVRAHLSHHQHDASPREQPDITALHFITVHRIATNSRSRHCCTSLIIS